MKTIEEVRKLKYQFITEYDTALGNQLSIGIGKDATTEEYTLEVRLTDDTFKSTVPNTYQGVKVNLEIIGPIVAL